MGLRVTLDRLIGDRELIGRRIGQWIAQLVSVVIGAATLQLHVQPKYTVPAAIGLVVLCFAVLFWSDVRHMKTHYHFDFFRPGSGTLRKLTSSGASRFLSLMEYKLKFYWEGEGIFLGRMLARQRPLGLFGSSWVGYRDDRHMLTIAPNRSGKGTAALVPNLLMHKGSALVIDPKGELARMTAARRGQGTAAIKDSLKQKIVVLDLLVTPEDCDRESGARLLPAGYPPGRWNPLAEFAPNDPDAVAKVQGIVFALIPPEPGSTDTFFINQSRGLLTNLILHVLSSHGEDRRNLIFVRRLLSQGDKELFNWTMEDCEEFGTAMPYLTPHEALFFNMRDNPSYGGKISGYASQLIALPPETRNNVIGDLYGRLNFLDLSKLEYMLQGSDFRLSDLKRQEMTLYVCAQGTRLGAELKPIITILIDLAVKALEATPITPKRPVLFIMDEFKLLGRLDSIDQAMGLIAGYGIRLWPVLQSMSQLQDHYPTSWKNFLANCAAIQYMGTQDSEVLDELEKRIGNTVTTGPNGVREVRPLLSRHELEGGYMQRESRRQLVIFSQEPAAPLELCDYFAFPWLNRLVERE